MFQLLISSIFRPDLINHYISCSNDITHRLSIFFAFFHPNSCIYQKKALTLQPILNECIMEATKTVSRRPNMVTVQMSQRRWNRILSLEQTYKLARAIKRSMDQVETAPAMSAEDAVATLRSL